MCVAPSSAALLYASFTADSARVSFVVIPPVQNPPPWPSTFPSDWHSPEGAAATPTILFPEAVRVVAAQPHSATADIIEAILSMLYPLPTSRFSYNYGLQPGRVNFSRSSRRQHLRNATPRRSPGSTRRSVPFCADETHWFVVERAAAADVRGACSSEQVGIAVLAQVAALGEQRDVAPLPRIVADLNRERSDRGHLP